MVAIDTTDWEALDRLHEKAKAPPAAPTPVAEALYRLFQNDGFANMNRYAFVGRMLDLMPVGEDSHDAWEPTLSALYDCLRDPGPTPPAEGA